MAEEPPQSPTKRKCRSPDCDNDAGSLQCPTCLAQGIKDSFFCSQECYAKNWLAHKTIHKPKPKPEPEQEQERKPKAPFNPFPTYQFSGPLRPVYPLCAKRKTKDDNNKTLPAYAGITLPDYAEKGTPKQNKNLLRPNKVEILDAKAQDGMRKVCRLAREVLDVAAAALRPGITTEQIDDIVHAACLERKSYPSPLNYNFFPKSVCTSVNEVICHGIPDKRPLVDGDIVNLDVTLYHEGYHGDLNETYYVGDKAKADPDSVRVVEAARECLNKAIELVKPGTLFREFGNVIEKHAKSQKCSVIRTYVGHGINSTFHCPPNIPHYAKNKAVGACKPGMTFTIEPMVALGTWIDDTWPDNWTSTTRDGKRTAQFEHTLLVTETGVEVLTARTESSPGGAIPMPEAAAETNGA